MRRASGWGRPLLVGAALAVVAFTAGSLMLYDSRGALPAAAGLVATFAAALAAGLWAGADLDDSEQPPVARWIMVGIALGVAGVVATVWRLYHGERMAGPGRAIGLLFIVGIPAYVIGYLLPALFAWEAARDETDDGEAGGATGSDVSVTALLAGAAVGAAAAGLFLIPLVAPGPLLLATAAVVTFPLCYPRRLRGDATERHVLLDEETPFGALRVEEIVYPGKRQPERRLYQNGEIESGELTRTGAPTFGYIAAGERVFAELDRPGLAYLFLGGGAYTLPRRVAERDPRARITVVELDPEVTRAAYRFFGLRPEHGVHSIHGDARMVAAGLPAASYDRVFVDVYDGSETVPYPLVTAEAMGELTRLLRPGGVVAMNVIGVADGEGDRRFWSTVRTVREAFPAMRLYYHLTRDFPGRQNFLLVAATDADARFPAAGGTFDTWPEAEWPRLSGTMVFHDRFADTPDRRGAGAGSPDRAFMPPQQRQPGPADG